MPPVRSRNIAPPLEVIVHFDWMIRRREHNRSGDEIPRRGAGKIFGPRLALRDRHIAGGTREFLELGIGDIGRVDEKAIKIHAVDRPRINRGVHAHGIHFGRITGAHGEFASRNPHHSLGSPAWLGSLIYTGCSESQVGCRRGHDDH